MSQDTALSRFMSWRYTPLLLVFLSGVGFSLQTLTIKKLEEVREYKGTFQLIFARGFVQMLVSLYFIKRYNGESKVELFGSTSFVRRMLALRSVVGFGGICFAFLALEKLPIGETTVLVMISPIFSTIFSYLTLGEPWRLAEFMATVTSICGVICVAQPEIVFGEGTHTLDPIGVVFGLIASVSAGAAYTCVRILGTTAIMPWWNVCFAQALGQIFFAGPLCFVVKENRNLPDLFEVCVCIAVGFLGAWSQIAMTVGMQREKSATATGMRMSDVFCGFLWQVLFTNDSDVSLLSIFGAVLVITSIVMLIVFKPKNDDNATASKGSSSILSVEMAKPLKSIYNVLQTNESDLESSSRDWQNETKLDISLHHEASDEATDIDNVDIDFGISGSLSVVPQSPPKDGSIRKRGGSLGSEPYSKGGIEDMKEKLRMNLHD